MAFSKITLNNDTLMDVTQDTVASSNLLSGETATGADGETVEGAIEIKQTGPTVVPTFNTSTGNIHIEATTESGYYDSNKTTTGNYTPAAIGIPTQGSKTVTPSESAQSAVTAGKYTTGEVTVGAISSTYVGSGITQRNADDMAASGASVTAPAGYYAEASSKAIATATQATPSVEINSSTGLVTATSAQAAGYVSGGTKTGTLQLSAQGAKTVTPSESSQTAVAAGKYTTGAVTVGAISSTYVGSGITKRSASDITASGAVVSVPAGYYASNGSKSVATTTHPDPTVSINSSTGLITASHTQGTGYVTGSTTTDTLQLSTQAATTITPTKSSQTAVEAGKYTTGAVTVGAISDDYIIPTGSVNIGSNGATDVSNYASAVVDVQPNVWVDSEGYLCLDTPVKDAVVFIDYDGTVLHTYTSYEFRELTSLPANPSHTGLVAQGWNWTRDQILTQMRKTPEQSIYVGQMYITQSGDTEIDVTFDDPEFLSPYLAITVGGTVVVDWGDGSSTDTMNGSSTETIIYQQHTYAQTGSYTISINVTSGSLSFSGGSTNYTGVLRTTNVAENKARNRVYACAVKAIRIGSNVTSIRNYAFNYCYFLSSITIPSEVTSIENYAFQSCYSLISITIPSGITSIGSTAFSNCRSLSSIAIPSGITSIGNSFFSNCSSLRSITIPSRVTSIAGSAFSGCCSITSITIPSGVTNIGNTAFSNCYSLSSITIPSSVTSIGGSAFQNCYSLTSITIPSGVTSIGTYAFQNCYSLTSITIPSGVTSILGSAFNQCYSLTSITIPSGVTSIESSAFNGCFSFTSIAIPSGVTSIAGSAFAYCNSITSIIIPSSVTSIGSSAFAYCGSLTSITIPSSVTSIESSAFSNCYSIVEYHILPATPPTLANANAFYNIASDCIIYVPVGALSTYQSATNWSTYASYMREEGA